MLNWAQQFYPTRIHHMAMGQCLPTMSSSHLLATGAGTTVAELSEAFGPLICFKILLIQALAVETLTLGVGAPGIPHVSEANLDTNATWTCTEAVGQPSWRQSLLIRTNWLDCEAFPGH